MKQIQWKLMTKFFFKFKNSLGVFLAHFSKFWGKKSFYKKLGCSAQLIRVSSTTPELKKI